MTTVSKHTTWMIDDFVVSDAPIDWIDPKIEEHDDGTVTVTYACDDDAGMDYEWGDVKFWQADRRYISPASREDTEAMPHVFAVERYEHGLVSYSLAADQKPYPDRKWDVALVGLIGLPDDFTGPREAAAGILEEYTEWANGNVYGIVRDTFRDGALVDTDAVWGIIGTEYAERCIESGDV